MSESGWPPEASVSSAFRRCLRSRRAGGFYQPNAGIVSPVPFGGVSDRDNHARLALLGRSQVSSAFRRCLRSRPAVGLYALRVCRGLSPVPFGGVSDRDELTVALVECGVTKVSSAFRRCLRSRRTPARFSWMEALESLQCLSAVSQIETPSNWSNFHLILFGLQCLSAVSQIETAGAEAKSAQDAAGLQCLSAVSQIETDIESLKKEFGIELSPVPFGGVSDRDLNWPRLTPRKRKMCLQCLSAVSQIETLAALAASIVLDASLQCLSAVSQIETQRNRQRPSSGRWSPVPFGGVSDRDNTTQSYLSVSIPKSLQCLSAVSQIETVCH